MKDKLVKNGRKKGYYRLRAVALSFGIFSFSLLCLSLPVLITYTSEAKAENQTSQIEEPHSIESESK